MAENQDVADMWQLVVSFNYCGEVVGGCGVLWHSVADIVGKGISLWRNFLPQSMRSCPERLGVDVIAKK